jgi:Spy/CpxP family protein refolding chaperone
MAGLALAAALTLAGVGVAQQASHEGQGDKDHAGRRWGGDGAQGEHGPFAKLNLTDDQKAKMKQIADNYRQTFKAARQHDDAEHQRPDLFSGGTFDENAVRAAAQARANAEVEREVAHARMMYEMYNVLTPDQKQQLATERQQWEQKRQERRAHRQANPGQTQQ